MLSIQCQSSLSMEVLKLSALTKSQFISAFPPTTSLTALNNKTRFKFREKERETLFKLSGQFRARFGRPTNRRNSLRKKLTHDLHFQVRPIPPKHLQLHPFLHNDSKPFGDSLSWNKLEGWFQQYKTDVEFWGIGTNPIFTVFQDSHGNIVRVSVDEDEIFRRSGLDPSEDQQLQDFDFDFEQLNSKIAHANFLAREIQSGRFALPNNTSIAKFVATVQDSGFLTRIRITPNFLPRVGLAMLCGFLFVWVVNLLFTWARAGNDEEMTRFDQEMLRRKIKSRMEKGKLPKGSVEVVELPSDTDFTKRPQLDKEELLNSIRNAQGFIHQEIESPDVDAKIQEIQIMARHARNIHKPECSPMEVELDESDDQTFSELLLMEKDASEQPVDTFKIDELKTQASDRRPTDTIEVQAEGHNSCVDDNHSNEWSTQPGIVNVIMKDQDPGCNDNERCCLKSSVEALKSSSLSDPAKGIQFPDVCRSQLDKVPVRRKPKVILSVREAREYLSQKHHQKPQDADAPTVATQVNDKIDNLISHQTKEDWKDSSGVDRSLEPVHAADVCGSKSNSVKGNAGNENAYQAVDINGLNEEANIRLMPNIASDSLGADGLMNEMFKHGNSSETSDVFLGENAFHDALMEEEYLPTEGNLDKINKMDELPGHTNIREVSDLVPGKSASIDAGNSSEDAAFHGVNLKTEACVSMEKNLDRDDGINETDKAVNPSEKSDPIHGAYDQQDSSSEDNAYFSDRENYEDDFRKNDGEDQILTAKTSLDFDNGVGNIGGSLAEKEKWLEKNFHEVEPIVKKIGAGFRNNYTVAREKVKQEDVGLDFVKLRSIKDDTELEWMQNDKLREIVFKVKENELAGRDPFHSMDLEDKIAFLKGLESKVEKENEKLLTLHAWLHSNIENIDYGADGISLYDPPDKVIPKWKGPSIDKIPEFLTNPAEQAKVASSLRKANESLQHDKIHISQTNSRPNEVAKISKTVIEASDGSIKPGQKSGKEYWQHTKKWSRGFLESYNAETDPEVKSVMKDIGKGLDRWITEEEIQEAAALMDKIPQRGKEYIEKKLNKLKREMEQFGPAAVVSKYREYAEEKEEDYLWWLDLRYVLCIELYTYEGEDQRVGFYSLEMAGDLELDPKPHHVIAFEDPSDCKNLCYIIQAHLEMLGSGRAFVVAQSPKDVFWQAKANGFGVTVVRKGELQLNVDQPLEEVEELITEIGSKMYHDKMMCERSVDISSLMKGVFGISKPFKRKRKKRAQKSLRKS